jgi:hypothetical protein
VTEQTTALTLAERARTAIGLPNEIEQKLHELAKRTTDIVVIVSPEDRAQVHGALMALKNQRIEIETAGKVARDDANKFAKAVIAEAGRLCSIIEPEEGRLFDLRKKWDDAIEAEKQAKIAAELKRVADLQARVAELRGNRMLTPPSGAALIAEHIGDVEGIAVDDSFQEFREQAETAKAAGLEWLRTVHAAAVAHETEQDRIKAEREELAKLRAEQAERDRLAAIERKALADKQAEEAAAERARIAEEERQARAVRDAEAAKQAEELHQMRVAQQQAADAERKRIADEEAAAKAIRDAEAAKQAEELRLQREAQAKADAEAKAIRDAEAKKLADERAAFEREQAEARRIKEEQERTERERARLASIKKPADDELLGVIAKHYNVPVTKVTEWLLAVDFTKLEQAA